MKHCSPEVVRAADWLAERMTMPINDVDYGRRYVRGVYALYKAQHPSAGRLLSQLQDYILKSEDFWSDLAIELEDEHLYLYTMGLANNEWFRASWEHAKSDQTVDGKFIQNSYPAFLLPLVCLEPDASHTGLAVSYFANHWQQIAHWEKDRTLIYGLQALLSYAPDEYHDLVHTLAQQAESRVTEIGPLKRIRHPFVLERACQLVQVLSAIYGPDARLVADKVKEIKALQEACGAWPTFIDRDDPYYKNRPDLHSLDVYTTSAAVLTLISAGEGPKVPVEELERQERLFSLELQARKAHAVATSPMDGIREIDDTARRLITSAERRLWICSRFITEYYTDIIQLRRDKTKADIRVITIPLREAKDTYAGHGRRFVEPAYYALQRTLENGFKSTEILHARCIISDDCVLVSSADLTREQLEHEMNLGMWTSDPDVVGRIAATFEQWWESI